MAALARIAVERILILDGGMGISLSRHNPKTADFGEHPGCNEYLNFSRPDIVQAVHEEFLAAGADIIETNSFGGARHILAEHKLESRCFSLNRRAAAIAHKAADRFSTRARPRFVAGSMGPGSRLPTLGHIAFDELHVSYSIQARGLLAGGADLLIVETCQDLVQAKAAVVAADDARTSTGSDAPIVVQFTLDEHGRTLTGSDPAALLAAFEPLRATPSVGHRSELRIRTRCPGRADALPCSALLQAAVADAQRRPAQAPRRCTAL
jgi:5-methyltetrahydrofolate--homocysteine methyltransferase